jgi:hypothetical protein
MFLPRWPKLSTSSTQRCGEHDLTSLPAMSKVVGSASVGVRHSVGRVAKKIKRHANATDWLVPLRGVHDDGV